MALTGRTVIGVFDEGANADRAIDALQAAGFSSADIHHSGRGTSTAGSTSGGGFFAGAPSSLSTQVAVRKRQRQSWIPTVHTTMLAAVVVQPTQLLRIAQPLAHLIPAMLMPQPQATQQVRQTRQIQQATRIQRTLQIQRTLTMQMRMMQSVLCAYAASS